MTRFGGRIATAAVLLFATPLAAQRSDRRVIDRAAIAAMGWHRLGEIAGALPPGSTASIDGFNHELRGSRLGFFQTTRVTATWLVRLDGQFMPMQIGGTWILDDIPVAIPQLDSIVITESAQLTDGRAAPIGTIDLYTRRARRASLVGDYQHGDETGDPGPYRYTPRSTPNVEKVGPFTSGAATVAGSSAALDVAARYSSLNITDVRLQNRLGAAFPAYQSDVNASGGSGIATLDMLGGRTYVVGGRGRFTGFFPTATDSDNQQARVVASHGGISGSAVAFHRAWTYAATGTQLETEPFGSAPLLIPEGKRVLADGLLETDIGGGLRAGLGGTSARDEVGTADRRYTSARAWMGYARSLETADLAVERSAGRLRYSGAARMDRILADSDRVGLSLTALQAWRLGDFAWMDLSTIDSSSMTALDVRAEIATGAIMHARPTWYARGFSYTGIGLTPVKGLAAGFVATTIPTASVGARLRGEVTQLLGEAGTGESSTPGGYVEGALSARAAGGFHIALAARFAPHTHWSGSVDDVPSTRRVDFSVNKAMWHDRVRAQLVMRNLLNVDERTHPEGAQWNLRTHLAVTVALPSGGGE